MSNRVLFITGTRADFGKIKALIRKVDESESLDYQIFATGMHMLSKYGNTVNEIWKSGFSNVFSYMNQAGGEEMEVVLANTVDGLSRYLQENPVELIVVHGDRVEALAGSIVGALRNILVAHVEGGELSGTVDELIRHSISKLSHIHFVTEEDAKRRLVQLGENRDHIFVIGSPDVDVMLDPDLPSLSDALMRYDIDYEEYAIAILHPVTTAYAYQRDRAECFFRALKKTDHNYIVIAPNNDKGSEFIFSELKHLTGFSRFRVFPSLRFEYFLTLLKNAQFIIGNSSAGIHEAPLYGVPTVNVGDRQHRRKEGPSIINCDFEQSEIHGAIGSAFKLGTMHDQGSMERGESAELFVKAISNLLPALSSQKNFNDVDFDHDRG